MAIQFFSQDIRFFLRKKEAAKKLIRQVIFSEKKKEGQINFIFCNDSFLLSLNKKFLKHHTLTDIITFPYPADSPTQLNADIFISIPRIKENAKKFKAPFSKELSRVMIHGVLHLCGYKDKKAGEKKEMRGKEEYYLKKGV